MGFRIYGSGNGKKWTPTVLLGFLGFWIQGNTGNVGLVRVISGYIATYELQSYLLVRNLQPQALNP